MEVGQVAIDSRESTPDLYPLDDLLNDLSLAYGGEALEVSGPHADSFGEYHYATLPDGTRFRVERNGFVKQVYRRESLGA